MSVRQKSNEDAQARKSAIGALLNQLSTKTQGAIGIDDPNETFDWDDHGVVHFRLRVSNCHQVDAYAATARQRQPGHASHADPGYKQQCAHRRSTASSRQCSAPDEADAAEQRAGAVRLGRLLPTGG